MVDKLEAAEGGAEYYKTNYPDLETYGTYNSGTGTGWRDPVNIY